MSISYHWRRTTRNRSNERYSPVVHGEAYCICTYNSSAFYTTNTFYAQTLAIYDACHCAFHDACHESLPRPSSGRAWLDFTAYTPLPYDTEMPDVIALLKACITRVPGVNSLSTGQAVKRYELTVCCRRQGRVDFGPSEISSDFFLCEKSYMMIRSRWPAGKSKDTKQLINRLSLSSAK